MPYTLQKNNRRFLLTTVANATPIDPGSVGSLVQWWRPEDLVSTVANGAATGNWKPYCADNILLGAGGVGNSANPTLKLNAFGNYPGVNFNSGSSQYYSFTNILTQNAPFSYVIMSNISTLPIQMTPFMGDVSPNVQYNYIWGGTQSSPTASVWYYDGALNSSLNFLNPLLGVTKIITVTINSANNLFSYYDGQTPIGTSSGANNMSLRWFGRPYNGSPQTNFLHGTVGEIMFFNSTLTAANVANLYQNYFKVKYASDKTLT